MYACLSVEAIKKLIGNLQWISPMSSIQQNFKTKENNNNKSLINCHAILHADIFASGILWNKSYLACLFHF